MQEIMNRIKTRAIELLADGSVSRVIGWEKGEGEADWSPALFESVEEMEGFVYGDYAGANLSKYCLKFNKLEGKTLVVLKPCDTLSFNQLLQYTFFAVEHFHFAVVIVKVKFDTFTVKHFGIFVQPITRICHTVKTVGRLYPSKYRPFATKRI